MAKKYLFGQAAYTFSGAMSRLISTKKEFIAQEQSIGTLIVGTEGNYVEFGLMKALEEGLLSAARCSFLNLLFILSTIFALHSNLLNFSFEFFS